MHILKAVLTSTFANNQQIDARRTPYIFEKESIHEATRQLNVAIENGNPIKIMFDVDGTDPNKKQVQQDDFQKIIGYVASAETVLDHQYNVLQTHANIVIEHDEFYHQIVNNSNDLCFFPIIAYHPQKSLRKAIVLNDGEDDISYINEYFLIRAINIGLKRSSSNPYLCIM